MEWTEGEIKDNIWVCYWKFSQTSYTFSPSAWNYALYLWKLKGFTYKRFWIEVPINKVLTEEIHLWYCRNMNLYFFRSFGLAQVIYCPFGYARAQFHSFQHYWLSLRKKKNNRQKKETKNGDCIQGGEKKKKDFKTKYMQTTRLNITVTTICDWTMWTGMLSVETKGRKSQKCFSIYYILFHSMTRKNMERQRQF